MLKESNNADQKLIVGSLEVLTDIKNHGLDIIKSTVNELQNEQKTEKQKTADFYAAMAEDGIITPIEKKTLKSELNTIERTHAAILSDAEKNKCKNIEEIKNYENLFGYLIVYLYSNLKVFDNPSENTQIDKEEFNRVFSDYYTAEKAAISSIDRKESHDYATQEDIKHHTATYLGSISKLPETLHSDYGIGDWFTWSGATEDCEIASNGKLIKGHIYKQIFIDDATHWQEVNPAEKDAQGFNVHSQEIMTALNDILSLNDAKDGYFQNVFASSFFAASAVIESLKVHFLRVANDGALQTDNYEPSKQGWIITDEQGAKEKNLKYPVEFMCPLHIGNKTDVASVIDGNVTFSGNVSLGSSTTIGKMYMSSFPLICQGKKINYKVPGYTNYNGGDDYLLAEYRNLDPTRSWIFNSGSKIKAIKFITNADKRRDWKRDSEYKTTIFIYVIYANQNSYTKVFENENGGWHDDPKVPDVPSFGLYYPQIKIQPYVKWAGLPLPQDFSKNYLPNGVVYQESNGSIRVYQGGAGVKQKKQADGSVFAYV